jgi:DNA-binding LacI/PurR family transcriptional regulator
MKDVARALDVSVSTVARSLADSPRISHDTKARVIAEAEKLGYVIDFAARAMRSGTSSLVGLIVPDLRNDFYSTAAKAISDICHEKRLQLILAITDDDPELELQHIRNLSSSRALGIVIIPSVDPAKETLRLLRVTPHVQLVRKCDKVASDWFGLDDLAAMQLATNHLLELGHRKLAFIGSTTAISTGRARLDGFRRTLAEAGIDPATAVTESGGCDAEFGYEAMGRILSVKDRPTGIVTAGARISIGAYDAARNAGVDIPGDLSFVGFSDAPAFRWWGASGLTTIGLPVEEIAMSSTSFLLRRAEMRNPPTAPPCEVVHRPVLIRRGSTAPPPAKK